MSRPDDERRHVVALVEIDRFEGLRRTIGYAAATQLLETLALDIADHFDALFQTRAQRSSVEVSFAAPSAADVKQMLDELVRALSHRIQIDGFGFDQSLTIGAVDHGTQPLSEEHVGLAERALGLARHGGGRIVVLDGAVGGGVDRISLMRRLQAAIRDDALKLHYQPKLIARTGEVAGVEALIRWRCLEAGPITPDQFIPIAEETGDIRQLTEWVVDRAVQDRAILEVAGYGKVRIEVNMPGTLLADGDFVDRMIARVAPGGMIGFEITETSTIANRADVLEHLRRCSAAGVRLAIDDYGAGFSSLAYLQQLPVHELKIDRSFISRLTSHQRDPLLVRSTIDLAHALDMEVTAEGVDSPHAMALLQVMGCDLLQGFYLSRPLPMPELLTYLADAVSRTGLLQRPRLTRRIQPMKG